MNDPVTLRKDVRVVLSAVPKRADGKRTPLDEAVIFKGVDKFCTDPLKVDELKAALQWNLSRGYVASQHDDDASAELWTLTDEGFAKEGLPVAKQRGGSK